MPEQKDVINVYLNQKYALELKVTREKNPVFFKPYENFEGVALALLKYHEHCCMQHYAGAVMDWSKEYSPTCKPKLLEWQTEPNIVLPRQQTAILEGIVELHNQFFRAETRALKGTVS